MALEIEAQGSFAVGGSVLRGADGDTLHGDHACVFFQVPVNARPYPLVFLHGAGQSQRTWQTTPDGREGFQNIFLRRGFPVYVVDQPRRGTAGRSTLPVSITPAADEREIFERFRLGSWPDYFPGVQFPREPEALEQYFRQVTPDIGAFDVQVISDALAALFDRIGPAVLVTHSQGGGPGWLTAIKSGSVRAIVSYEPGSNFVFAEDQVPVPMAAATGPLAAIGVPAAQFRQLTRIPVTIVYGDNIASEPVAQRGPDHWRVRLAMARRWAECVNGQGGDASVVHLPEFGIHGNTHFPFSDLNNLQVADLLSEFLERKQLDTHNQPAWNPS